METNTYGNLIKLIKALAGVTTFTDAELTNISHLINRRYREAYNTSQSWPRYLANSEERKVAAFNLSGGSGSAPDNTEINQDYQFVGLSSGGDADEGTEIYQGLTNTDSGIFKKTDSGTTRWFIATDLTFTENSDGTVTLSSFDTPGDQEFRETASDANTSHPSEVAAWTPNTTFTGQNGTPKFVLFNKIPYAETGLDSIGEFIKIHRTKAYLDKSAVEYDFFIDVDGANILNLITPEVSTAFVTYKKRLTLFSVTSSWESSSVAVPIEFFYYIAHAVYADVLRLESKYDDAQKEEAFASQYLAQELEKIDIIANNNNLKKKFSTHLNRNSR
jgi:hypothetical protein